MKLYLAYKNSVCLMEGEYEHCLGVFDSKERAWDFLKTTDDFKFAEKTRSGWTYHFDGELSYFWYVQEVELNKPL
jgi:hypothetical protein